MLYAPPSCTHPQNMLISVIMKPVILTLGTGPPGLTKNSGRSEEKDMGLSYQSTRGGERGVTASQAILKGLAGDGGLFMPDHIPALDIPLKKLAGLSYQETAYQVMKLFLTDFTETELKDCIAKAYDGKFDTEAIAPLAKAGDAYFLELYHGSTIAFKDMALSILPHLMTAAARKNGISRKIVILTATSGDTGKAAMAGFADVPGTQIIVFYPKDGVSPIQELQMRTQKGENTSVVAIGGNFDDAQSGVKRLFADEALKGELEAAGFQFSSANSINIGRLVPQIVYYVYAYAKLLENGEIGDGEEINVAVPTGNFGNILAAYFAKRMGLPIKTLICASNDNKVLYDFFTTGTYDRNREFILTESPSMDILISSNLERLIYMSAGCDAKANGALMRELETKGSYTVTPDMRRFMEDFQGGFATQKEDGEAIRRIFKDTGYLVDTHTGVAAAVYKAYRDRTGDTTKTVIASTASPYKFARSVLGALKGEEIQEADEFAVAEELSRLSGVPVPAAVGELRSAPILHDRECAAADMKAAVKEILKI